MIQNPQNLAERFVVLFIVSLSTIPHV